MDYPDIPWSSFSDGPENTSSSRRFIACPECKVKLRHDVLECPKCGAKVQERPPLTFGDYVGLAIGIPMSIAIALIWLSIPAGIILLIFEGLKALFG